ncbi:uncharacterized protein LAESUDRAFT_747463 [Laetiporus sulphureus 93-53]|uniref:Uncharacterized protein n=1 Tax=Laetiporus sulphureus 93-53 TaxID=1314785 RepID=A0A165GUW1_9APHY|nr:uncharacterized protein LAESUDRAFT_747463 [Laetiporus sulphureus 93-53]KZT10845.1 hypothetical protein LAESUDRAFT_747463 [Laetiporus sulphureus 93-53]
MPYVGVVNASKRGATAAYIPHMAHRHSPGVTDQRSSLREPTSENNPPHATQYRRSESARMRQRPRHKPSDPMSMNKHAPSTPATLAQPFLHSANCGGRNPHPPSRPEALRRNAKPTLPPNVPA